jgi:hypothetical protein
MTEQEIYDKVARHLLIQGKPSLDTSPGASPKCLYLHPQPDPKPDLMCAAGCLMDMTKYSPDMEYKPATDHEIAATFPFEVTPRIEGLINDLQGAHDAHLRHSVPQWIDAMRRLAPSHNLSPAVFD